MGLFGFLKKETEVTQSKFLHFKDWMLQSFSELKEEMQNHRQWINYLHGIQDGIKKSHEEHRSLTNKDLEDIKKWILYLDKRAKKNEDFLHSMHEHMKAVNSDYEKHYAELVRKLDALIVDEEKIRKAVLGDVGPVVSRHIDETKNRLEELAKSHEKTQEQLLKVAEKHEDTRSIVKKVADKHLDVHEELAKIRAESEKRLERHESSISKIDDKSRNAIAKVEEKHEVLSSQVKQIAADNKDAIKKIEHMEEVHKEHLFQVDQRVQSIQGSKPQVVQPQPGLLTNPEQKFLNILVSEADPVSYSTLAEKTGNSINTVRVIINTLKKRGLIQENMLPSGVKLFSATDKEKIKKLSNIKLL
jgi:DNA repair exonuclease SbcCD ATPase subunit